MKKEIISIYVLLGVIFFILSACNGNGEDRIIGDNFNSFSAVLTGGVTFHNSGEPVEGATVYLNERGTDCERRNSFLGEPDRFDSTETNTEGEFTIKFSLETIEQPVCIEVFAEIEDGNEVTNSDTVEFTTPLRLEEPFDTTSVNIMFGF